MDGKTLAEILLKVTKTFNTSTQDTKKMVLKIIVMGLKYIDREALWHSLLGDTEFVDWDLLKRQKVTENILGSAMVWIKLLEHLQWDMQKQVFSIYIYIYTLLTTIFISLIKTKSGRRAADPDADACAAAQQPAQGRAGPRR